MKGTAERLKLYEEYISYYEDRSHEGNISLCDKLDGQLLSACDSLATPGSFYSQPIRENFVRSKEEHRAEVLRRTMKGFAILELICVNLFLYPWRKEIRTLKKFTGNFIYFVEPVIPKETIRQILQRVGYSIVTDTEYIMGRTVDAEEAKLAAFELYLSRIQCEELILLINEGRTDCVNLFINGPSTERKNEMENSGLAVKSNYKVADDRETEDINNLNSKRKKSEQINFKNSKKQSDNFTLAAAQKNGEDSVCETSTKRLNYCYNKHFENDEFLNKYSDLNLAQQPIFPLHNRQININLKELKEEWVQLAYAEPNIVKPHHPESFAKESEPGTSKGGELAQDPNCDHKCENIDVRTSADGQSRSDAKRPPVLSESPVELNMPNKQGQSERLVNKLKMETMVDEPLTCPVEETLPPDPVDFSNSNNLCQWKPTWTFRKSKDVVDGATSPASTSGFSIMNKVTEGSAFTEYLNRLREPPNSTYIPPGVAERQCLRITDLQPEENHLESPSPSADMVLVNESLYDMNEDTREDFVMITKKDPLQN
ncbi:uncharacterized protein LOC142104378 [Mixophyes fleayi]|uniref:uncharacterized protein LOC142104378 n=1 Tax=Mixophyes fleayi TaxID=3061075 RepID=UPI003F4DE299